MLLTTRFFRDKPRFLNLGTTDVLSLIILCRREHHSWLLPTAGLQNPWVGTTEDPKVSLAMDKCSLDGKITLVGNRWSEASSQRLFKEEQKVTPAPLCLLYARAFSEPGDLWGSICKAAAAQRARRCPVAEGSNELGAHMGCRLRSSLRPAAASGLAPSWNLWRFFESHMLHFSSSSYLEKNCFLYHRGQKYYYQCYLLSIV